MSKTTPRIVALATVGALALAGFGAASAANADTSQILTGTITLYGPHNGQSVGAPLTGGNISDSPMYYGISTTAGCPTGFQARSDTSIYQNGTRLGQMSQARDASTTLYGSTGLTGAPVNMSDVDNSGVANPYVANKGLSGLTSGALQAGAFELRYWCEALTTSVFQPTDKYFVLNLVANADGTWSYPGSVSSPVASTTALSGTLDTAAKTAALTATVAQASGSTIPAGSVDFYDGTTKVGTTPVDSTGKATFTTAALADGSHSFTATYVPSDATKFTGSTSGAFTVQVGGTVYDVTVTIPSGTGALTLGGYTRSTVDLGTATLNGGSLTATGTLPGGLTVTDSRQLGAAAWSLTGQDSDFSTSDNSKSFDGGFLGWVPVVGSGSQGAAGATVSPITSTSDTDASHGLKSAARVLASGQVTSANAGTTVTAVGAQLNLAVPAQTAAGSYHSVLTLTLS